MKKYLFLPFILFLLPTSSFAVTLKTFVQSAIDNVVYTSVSLIVSLAVLAFFIGVIKFLIANRNGVEEGVTEGKQAMLWSTVSIFVIISVFGIVQLAKVVFGMGDATGVSLPSLQNTMFGQSSFNMSGLQSAGYASPVGGQVSSGVSSVSSSGGGTFDFLGKLFGNANANTPDGAIGGQVSSGFSASADSSATSSQPVSVSADVNISSGVQSTSAQDQNLPSEITAPNDLAKQKAAIDYQCATSPSDKVTTLEVVGMTEKQLLQYLPASYKCN